MGENPPSKIQNTQDFYEIYNIRINQQLKSVRKISQNYNNI